MQENKKILALISGLMFAFLAVIIITVFVYFRSYSLLGEYKKATVIASLVKDGLSAHMASGTMNQRRLFLENAKKSSGALDVWIFRTDKVVKLFGEGFKNEKVRDSIDKKVIQTAKIQNVVNENFVNPTMRITIPYIATSNSNPNCLNCHTNAKEGEVLGGISIVFDTESVRFSTLKAISKIIGIALLFIIVFIYIASRLFKPYIGALVVIKETLEKASMGNYKTRIEIKGDDKSTETFKWLNTLLEKLENTIGSIEKNVSLFVADRNKKFSDPLEKSQFIIEDLAMIYKFKKTIEHDEQKDIIYERLIKVFKEQLKVSDLSLYEVDIKNDKRVLIYDDTPEKFCESADLNTSKRCRAYRTNAIIASDEFPDICKACKTDKEYLCINFSIDENISLVINIKPDNKDELLENKKAIGYIRNYFESARPVLQSRILNEILQKSNMIDGLTGLYNRKYLDIFMDRKIKQYNSFSLAMIDIDFFKKVNDTFGHDAGDIVLKGLSDIFKNSIEKDDIAFRFGGEEFLIFIVNTKNALNTIRRIKDNFEDKAFNLNGDILHKTLSAGIASYDNDGSSPWQVIKYADVAMYEAKNSGRNRIVLYKDIEEGKTNLKNSDEY